MRNASKAIVHLPEPWMEIALGVVSRHFELSTIVISFNSNDAITQIKKRSAAIRIVWYRGSTVGLFRSLNSGARRGVIAVVPEGTIIINSRSNMRPDHVVVADRDFINNLKKAVSAIISSPK